MNWYACTGPNVWSVQSGGSGGGGGEPGLIAQASDLGDLTASLSGDSNVVIKPGVWGVGNAPASRFAGSTVSIQALTVTNASNTNPIVLTVSNISGTSLRQADTIMVSGVQGNTAANGTWTVEILSLTTLRLLGSTGNGSYGGGGTVAGTGNGAATIYGTPQGYISIEFSSSSGLILRCTGSCVMNQAPSPGFGLESVPIANLTIVAGRWSAASDERRFLSARGIVAGQGILVADAGGTATVAVDSTVARTSNTNNYTGANNFTLAARTAPNRAASGAPAASCAVGDTYFRTDAVAGKNLHLCTATNIWTQAGGGDATWFQSFPAGTCNDTGPGAGYKAEGTAGQQTFCVNDSAHLAATTTGGWTLTAGVLPSTWAAAVNSITITLAASDTDGPGTIAFTAALGCSANDTSSTASFGAASTISIAASTTGRTYIGSASPAIPAGCTPGSLLKIRIFGHSSATISNNFNAVSLKVSGI